MPFLYFDKKPDLCFCRDLIVGPGSELLLIGFDKHTELSRN